MPDVTVRTQGTANYEIADPDVIVIIRNEDGEIINGSGGVLRGMVPTLGSAVLGYMTIGGD